MKRFYSFGLFAIVLLCGCATTRPLPVLHKNEHTYISHKEGVDSIYFYEFRNFFPKDGDPETMVIQESQKFNKWGYLLSEERHLAFSFADTTFQKKTNTYNEFGQIIRNESFCDNSLSDYTDYTYTAKGLIASETAVYSDCVPVTTKYFYDRHNNNIRKEFYQADSLISWENYKYNKQGLLLEETHLRGADSATTYSISHIYDRHNRKVKTTTLSHFSSVIKFPCVPIVEDYKNSHLNKETWGKVKEPVNPIKLDTLIECYSYTNTGKLSEVQSWCSSLGAEWYISEKREYHDNGNVAKKITWGRCITKDGIRPMQVEIYNKQGLVIERQDYSNDLKALRTVVRTEYNDQGKETAQMKYDWKGKLNSVEHNVYDDYGNLTERWCFQSNGEVDYRQNSVYIGDVLVEEKIYYDNTRLKSLYTKTAEGGKKINYNKKGNVVETTIYVQTPELQWKRVYGGSNTDVLIHETREEVFKQ